MMVLLSTSAHSLLVVRHSLLYPTSPWGIQLVVAIIWIRESSIGWCREWENGHSTARKKLFFLFSDFFHLRRGTRVSSTGNEWIIQNWLSPKSSENQLPVTCWRESFVRIANVSPIPEDPNPAQTPKRKFNILFDKTKIRIDLNSN